MLHKILQDPSSQFYAVLFPKHIVFICLIKAGSLPCLQSKSQGQCCKPRFRNEMHHFRSHPICPNLPCNPVTRAEPAARESGKGCLPGQLCVHLKLKVQVLWVEGRHGECSKCLPHLLDFCFFISKMGVIIVSTS